MTDPSIAMIDYMLMLGADLVGDSKRESVQLLTEMFIELKAESHIQKVTRKVRA